MGCGVEVRASPQHDAQVSSREPWLTPNGGGGAPGQPCADGQVPATSRAASSR